MIPRPSHEDSSRFDLVEGMRAFNYQCIVKPLLDDYPSRVAERVAAGGSEPVTKEEAGELYANDPDYLFACAIQRNLQQLGWASAVDSIHRDGTDFADELARSVNGHQSSLLDLAPDLPLPAWYTWHNRNSRDDIHLVPGGYWGDDLVGPIYERGGSVYRLAWRGGYDARPGALEEFVRGAPAGDYRRVIDLGCSFGGVTRVLRKVFADAEVIGIDLSVPALTYAHYVAERDQQRITYAQRDAVATGYDPDTFDLVTAFLLLHEVPDEIRAAIMTEAFRIMKPGGQLMFLDIPPYSQLSPAEAYFESFDGRGNGENFWESFLSSDFPGLLASVGFENIEQGPLTFDEPGYWGSAALWRTGDFNPVHRWVTRAVKPARLTAAAS